VTTGRRENGRRRKKEEERRREELSPAAETALAGIGRIGIAKKRTRRLGGRGGARGGLKRGTEIF